jgi:pimeloyl-ACP methyl ester carboxylesterase
VPFSLDRDPADRAGDRLLAPLGLLEDAAPLFGAGTQVPGVGVLLEMPALVGVAPGGAPDSPEAVTRLQRSRQRGCSSDRISGRLTSGTAATHGQIREPRVPAAYSALCSKVNPEAAARPERESKMKRFVEVTRVSVLVVVGSLLGTVGSVAGAELERGRLVDVGGQRLFLDCVGTGAPTVVIDGGANTWSIFYRHIQDEIARDTRACTYDRAGYGASDPGPEPRTASVLADELHRLLQAAGENPPYVLVGHSLGGYVIRIYERRHGSDVAALVLVESGHPEQWERLPAGVREVTLGAVPMFRAVAEAARAGQLTVEQLDPWVLKDHGQDLRPAYEREMLTPEPWLAAAAEFNAAPVGARQVPEGDLGKLPLVVVTAGRSFDAFVGSPIPIEESNPVWLELQAELVRLSKVSEQILSPDSHHNIEQTDPAAFVDGIRRAVAAARKNGSPAGTPAGVALIHRLPHTSTPEVDALLAGLEQEYRAMDPEGFISYFTEDVEQLDVNRRVLVRGHTDWLRQTGDVNGAHVWMERNHHGRALVGDRVVVEIEWAGRVRGEALGRPGEDQEYRYVGLGILDLRDGKIASQVLFGDFVTLVEQLGLSERPTWRVSG